LNYVAERFLTPTQSVRRYYEQNTRLFLRFGSATRSRSIHRAVWSKDANSLDDALNFSNALVLNELHSLCDERQLSEASIVDLGCGVGGSLDYLLRNSRHSLHAFGVTLSGSQAKHASAVLQQRASVLEADYQHLPFARCFDLAYAIESFVHSPDASRFFAQAANALRYKGRLIVCDDVLAERELRASNHTEINLSGAPFAAQSRRNKTRYSPSKFSENERFWLDAYRRGWQANSLIASRELIRLAREQGFKLLRDENFTPMLRLRALPNPLARLALRVGEKFRGVHAIVPSSLGSIALQQALRDGVIEYRFMVFEYDG
jgi:cyclopropane fatty-acyl-phospholipid synthase-like methyltransferase